LTDVAAETAAACGAYTNSCAAVYRGCLIRYRYLIPGVDSRARSRALVRNISGVLGPYGMAYRRRTKLADLGDAGDQAPVCHSYFRQSTSTTQPPLMLKAA